MLVIIARNDSTPWDRRGGLYVSERVFMVMIHDLKQRDRGGGQSFEVPPEVPCQSTRELSNHCYGVGDADGVNLHLTQIEDIVLEWTMNLFVHLDHCRFLSLYEEYVVRFFLPDDVFYLVTTGWIFDISFCGNSIN